MAKLITFDHLTKAANYATVLVKEPVSISMNASIKPSSRKRIHFNGKLTTDRHEIIANLAEHFGFNCVHLPSIIEGKCVTIDADAPLSFPAILVTPLGTKYFSSLDNFQIHVATNTLYAESTLVSIPYKALDLTSIQTSFCYLTRNRSVITQEDNINIRESVIKAFTLSGLDLGTVVYLTDGKRALPIDVNGRANKAQLIEFLRAHDLLT